MGASGALEQREILHVASPDLNHVGPLGDQVEGFVVQGFGYDAEAVAVADLSQDAESLDAQTLKCIRGGAGLECTATEELRTRRGHLFGNGEGLIPILNGAGACDDGKRAASDGGVSSCKADDGVFFFNVPAGQLVGLRDPDHFGNPGEGFQVAAVHFALIAGDANGGALGSGKRVGTETQLINMLADRLDLLRRGLRFHDNQHGQPLKPSV